MTSSLMKPKMIPEPFFKMIFKWLFDPVYEDRETLLWTAYVTWFAVSHIRTRFRFRLFARSRQTQFFIQNFEKVSPLNGVLFATTAGSSIHLADKPPNLGDWSQMKGQTITSFNLFNRHKNENSLFDFNLKSSRFQKQQKLKLLKHWISTFQTWIVIR